MGPVKMLATAFCLFAATAMAGDMESVRAELAARAAKTRSIQSEFTQEKHLSLFAEVLTSKGLFAYGAPDSLRWELTEPARTGFVISGGKGVRWHDLIEGDEELSIDRDPVMKAVAGQLMAWASADFDTLSKQYEMELAGERPVRFKLTPKGEAASSFISSVEVTFSNNSSYVEEVTVREAGGDHTRMRFTGVRINEPLPPGIFEGR